MATGRFSAKVAGSQFNEKWLFDNSKRSHSYAIDDFR